MERVAGKRLSCAGLWDGVTLMALTAMRVLVAVAVLTIGFELQALGQTQACTGLCLQQVSCPNGGTTTLTGVVSAPNGTDPLPNVTVYIPNAPVDAFTPGVSCPVVGAQPSGSPLVGTTTGVDGSFTLTNVPVGANIPLVIVAGKWRRQVTIPGTVACASTAVDHSLSRMPRNKSEGDIPLIAVATGSADEVECALRKIGIDDAEFTNPAGTGRINVFLGEDSAGARIDTGTPSENTLMSNASVVNQYDVVMLPCEGSQYIRPASQLANIISYANAGGRVYTSHYGYVWMYNNPPFNGVANWAVSQSPLADGLATVDTSFTDGQTMSQWLQLIGASTTPGQIEVMATKHDLNGVIAPTQSWLTLNDSAHSNPVMQFTFNTPIGSPNQCGRVLYNEYHVENPVSSPTGKSFPAECPTTAMTPQEKLLEYSLFDLTNNGGGPTMTPTSADFGNGAAGFQTASQAFQWTNNSTFSLEVTSATVTSDYVVTSPACGSVGPGKTCEIDVAFKPTALGARPGTLTVVSPAKTLTATLTGTGVTALTGSPTTLSFGNLDVGTTATQTITVTNNANGAVPVPGLITTGDFTATSACGVAVAPGGTCTITVAFKPTVTGARTGTLNANSSNAAYAGVSVQMTGNGVDFTLAINPGSGSLVAGNTISPKMTATPIAGFANMVTLSCTTTAPASTCVPASMSFVPTGTGAAVTITTTSRYTVIGYGGFVGGGGLLPLMMVGSGWLLWRRRKGTSGPLRGGVIVLTLAAGMLAVTGCSGKYPSLNNPYTTAGSYTYTLTATDGTLTHSTTYSLQVTAQ
jgi:Abnormal spindle-like microcephaly-assoc'd, ASPM-SPD-2-Hydin